MQLNPLADNWYTKMEVHLFDKLPKDGSKVSSAYIEEKLRKSIDKWDVKFPLKNITVTMARLMQKVADNGEPFRIRKDDKRTGHHLVEYWLEPKRRRRNGR